MAFLIILLSIITVQIPGLILRYLPYTNALKTHEKKILLKWYALGFFVQILAVCLLTRGEANQVTPLTYKRMLFILSTIYVAINIFIIKGSVYKHIFIYGMQGGYSLFIHSIVALIVHHYSDVLTLPSQIALQTLGYTFLFVIVFIPFWKKLKHSIIFNSVLTDAYYWNVIWMIPALAIYSDAMVTMNHEWINSFPQVLSRIMTAISLIISWKWITLDFKSLEKMLQLKNANQVLHMQSEALSTQSQILTDAENKIKIYKHDMRHQLGIISTLVIQNNNQTALQVIERMNEQMTTALPVVYCKNILINSAIAVYHARAQEKNISVKIQLDIPELLPWSDSDLAILIANAFENAIQACEKSSHHVSSDHCKSAYSDFDQENQDQEHQDQDQDFEIEIFARYDARQLAIVIKNKFYEEIEFGKNGFPTTSQPNHGIGMHSITTVINKYNAHASCSHKDNWFEMTFLFVK